ncbi:MAG: ABC transporter substrate-binding protein, partial [Candidatus Bipolaricaulota bacterium]
MQNFTKFYLTVTVGLILVFSFALLSAAEESENEFTFATYQETMTFDPAKSVDETELGNVFNTYDPLVYPVKGEAPKPWVAESWEVGEDGKTYVFQIRKGIEFHDGNELTAEDVEFSMERMLRINEGFAWLWTDILTPEGVTATGEYEVTFELEETFGPFIATLVQFNIVNKELLMEEKKSGDFGDYGDYGQEYLETNDAGSGPYEIDSVTLGDEIVFTKFDDYWKGWEENQVEKAIWKVIPERATMDTLLKKGEIDMIDQWGTPEEYEELDKVEGVKTVEDPNVQLYLHQMNNKKEPLDDMYIRKAISYAFDYETALNDVFKGADQARGSV